MNDTNLLKVAAVLGVLCGVLEFYQAITFVEDVKRGATNAARVYCILVVPLIIIAGAAAVYFDRVIIGAGTILNGLALQHTMVDLAGRHFLAFGLGLAAVGIALYVQRKRDVQESAADAAPADAIPAAAAR